MQRCIVTVNVEVTYPILEERVSGIQLSECGRVFQQVSSSFHPLIVNESTCLLNIRYPDLTFACISYDNWNSRNFLAIPLNYSRNPKETLSRKTSKIFVREANQLMYSKASSLKMRFKKK